MNVGALTSGMPDLAAVASSGTRPTAPTSGAMPFGSIMAQFVQDVDQQQHVVTQGVHDMMTGKTENIHEIAINVAQADISFRLAMEVRDKLITAYQEVMRMQV